MGSTGKTTASGKSSTFSSGVGSSYKLGQVEARQLEEGNTYTFAHEFINAYPEIAGRNNFGFHEAVNSYRAYIDYNDGIYTFYGEEQGIPTKYFFDTKMRRRGTKQ